jgi:hypothetical protein
VHAYLGMPFLDRHCVFKGNNHRPDSAGAFFCTALWWWCSKDGLQATTLAESFGVGYVGFADVLQVVLRSPHARKQRQSNVLSGCLTRQIDDRELCLVVGVNLRLLLCLLGPATGSSVSFMNAFGSSLCSS